MASPVTIPDGPQYINHIAHPQLPISSVTSQNVIKGNGESRIPSLIILAVFYLRWKDSQENARMFYAFIGCIISAITFPFSIKIIQEMAIRFTRKEFWQKNFFTNPVGRSFTAIFELFCFVISVPVVAIYLKFIFCKALSGKRKGIFMCH
ncbi:colicin transporter [Salmonella enterica subsp. enterica serovar Javiana]|nr:colicin transporter [Salmonella enterica]EDR8063845.1 colicin transporter [Salmonella enterica subsp. enterica serovar Javiana]